MDNSVKRLRDTVDSCTSFISSLPEHLVSPRPWGPREVLVHLVFWHETYPATTSAMLKNEEPRLPVGTGRELNALAVEQNAGEPIARLIERFQATQGGIERLAALDRSHSLPVLTKAGAKPRTFEGLLRDVERHIRNHDARLRKGLRLTNPKPSLSRTV